MWQSPEGVRGEGGGEGEGRTERRNEEEGNGRRNYKQTRHTLKGFHRRTTHVHVHLWITHE